MSRNQRAGSTCIDSEVAREFSSEVAQRLADNLPFKIHRGKSCGTRNLYIKRCRGFIYLPVTEIKSFSPARQFLSGIRTEYSEPVSEPIKTVPGYQWIVSDSDLLGGQPAVKDTRLSVSHILACFAEGMSSDDVARDYAGFPPESVAKKKFKYSNMPGCCAGFHACSSAKAKC